ncbi:MAG TPA: hypothetical protein VGQ91_10635, partial [Ideonella sp.]|nr:hypothetical protein [Ideonella sp.]
MKALVHAALWLCLSLGAQAATTASAREDQVQIHGTAAGTQRVQVLGPGKAQAEYSFNDRGRGDHITARGALDAQGLPISYEAEGNDYWKVPLTERFELSNGRAVWKNRVESGEAAWPASGAFYLPANAPP